VCSSGSCSLQSIVHNKFYIPRIKMVNTESKTVDVEMKDGAAETPKVPEVVPFALDKGSPSPPTPETLITHPSLQKSKQTSSSCTGLSIPSNHVSRHEL
jgi:hypothetical protein